MQTRYWLAGTVTAAVVTAGALAANPILHGQTAARPSAEARASAEANAARNESRDDADTIDVVVSQAVEEALHDLPHRIDVDVREAVEHATRIAQDVARDIDVSVAVDEAMQGMAGLTSLGGQPRLGIGTRDITADEARAAGLPGITGAWVSDVRAESAAGKAGLQAKDIVVSVDGETVRSARHLARLVQETPEGRALQIGYVRGTAKNSVSVTPEAGSFTFNFQGPGEDGPIVRRFERRVPDVRERGNRERFEFFGPGQDFAFRNGPGGATRIWVGRGRLGIVGQPLTDQLASYFGVKDGLLVTSVNENTPAAKAGLKAGDVVTAVNGKAVKDTGDVIEHLQDVENGKPVQVEITRDRKAQTITVTLDAPSNTSGDRPVIRKPRFTA
ncbi:MAG TPA: PDZ domain-containing protein [Luteitalea sp.]|nr:PDZ domain-containing protein [Luteitalea sp.]